MRGNYGKGYYNSLVTEEGLEMGRAQVMQAEAAGLAPLVCMNPILLKPTDHTGSQVIVNGQVIGNMSAREYFSYKRKLIPDIKRAYRKLEEMADILSEYLNMEEIYGIIRETHIR